MFRSTLLTGATRDISMDVGGDTVSKMLTGDILVEKAVRLIPSGMFVILLSSLWTPLALFRTTFKLIVPPFLITSGESMTVSCTAMYPLPLLVSTVGL